MCRLLSSVSSGGVSKRIIGSNNKLFSFLWKSCANPILFCKSAFPRQYLSCTDSGENLPESLGTEGEG